MEVPNQAGNEAGRVGATRPTTDAGPRPGDLLVLAIWVGVLVGLLETGCVGFRIYVQRRDFVLDQTAVQSVHVLWMTPLADAFLFLVAGTGAAALAWVFPRLLSLRTVVSIYAGAGFFCVLLHVDSLHTYAALALAAGLGIRAGQNMATHPHRLSTFIHRSTAWVCSWARRRPCPAPRAVPDPNPGCLPDRRQVLVGASTTVAGLAAGVALWRTGQVRRALAALPPAPTAAPNVLLIVLDTVRAESLSLYGYHRPTAPHLERFARTSVCFRKAMSCAPWTLPSHACMFTGRLPHELDVDWLTPLDNRHPTLAEALRAKGYETAGFVANTLYCGRQTGLNRGFIHYEDFPVRPEQVILASALGNKLDHKFRRLVCAEEIPVRKRACDLNREFLSWLGRRSDRRRPFFAFLNYFDAHEPYIPLDSFKRAFGARVPERYGLDSAHRYSAEEAAALQDAYDRCIAGQDDQLGQLFDELGRSITLDNTVVIVTADHGEQFGEHGLMDHGNSLYAQLLHVPLVISFPSRLSRARTVRRPVSLRELPATVLRLANIENEWGFPGAPLVGEWESSAPSGDPYLLAELRRAPAWAPPAWRNLKGPLHSLVCRDLHYIRDCEGKEELYDLERDSSEAENLAKTEIGSRALRRFRQALGRLLGVRFGENT